MKEINYKIETNDKYKEYHVIFDYENLSKNRIDELNNIIIKEYDKANQKGYNRFQVSTYSDKGRQILLSKYKIDSSFSSVFSPNEVSFWTEYDLLKSFLHILKNSEYKNIYKNIGKDAIDFLYRFKNKLKKLTEAKKFGIEVNPNFIRVGMLQDYLLNFVIKEYYHNGIDENFQIIKETPYQFNSYLASLKHLKKFLNFYENNKKFLFDNNISINFKHRKINFGNDLMVKGKNFFLKIENSKQGPKLLEQFRNTIIELVKNGNEINFSLKETDQGAKHIFYFPNDASNLIFAMNKDFLKLTYNFFSNILRLKKEDYLNYEKKILEKYKLRTDTLKILRSDPNFPEILINKVNNDIYTLHVKYYDHLKRTHVLEDPINKDKNFYSQNTYGKGILNMLVNNGKLPLLNLC